MKTDIQEHIVVIDGKEYVPADIAVEAIIEAVDAEKNLSKALTAFQGALRELNNTDFDDIDDLDDIEKND